MENNNLKVTRKSYNPFRMWGSWVGLITVIFLTFLSPLSWLIGYSILEKISILLVQGENAFFWQVIGFILSGIILGLMGFLLGWGIHSLVRRLKK